jgi:hypothetical protein
MTKNKNDAPLVVELDLEHGLQLAVLLDGAGQHREIVQRASQRALRWNN